MTIWEHGPWPAFSSLLLGIFSYVNWTTFFVAEFCRCESTEWAVYPSVARQDPDNPCSAYKMLYFGIYARWRPIHESDALSEASMDTFPRSLTPLLRILYHCCWWNRLMEKLMSLTQKTSPDHSQSVFICYGLFWPLRGCSELQS